MIAVIIRALTVFDADSALSASTELTHYAK
jgi:hypothetical protein